MVKEQKTWRHTHLWRVTVRLLKRLLLYVAVILVLLPAAFVFFWMLSSSLKQPVNIYAIPPNWIPDITLRHYVTAFEQTPFFRYMLNSAIVAVASSVMGLVIGLPAAYSIARYRQNRLGLALLTSRIMPGVAYLVPLFVLFLKLRMIGTYPALILSHLVVTFPVSVWIMVGFFEDLPTEILDAALIDGCSKIGMFWRIAIPLVKPGIATAAILGFIFSWNDFKMALILSDSSTRTLPVAAFSFVHEAAMDWGGMMAYATVITLPALILTLFVQRHIASGLTMGGIKG